MLFQETRIKGAYIIDVQPITDERGFFARSFCKSEFEKHDLNFDVQQANISFNKQKGTLRGLHMQMAPYAEMKLVRCTRGAIFDVLVDLRESSDTYLQWTAAELTTDNYKMLLIPEGCAHGYLTLSDNTEVTYQVSQKYQPGFEVGYKWDDPAFNIDWPIDPIVISEKDKAHSSFTLTKSHSI